MAAEFDFIVVGSGAGGGPLACKLAEAPEGYRVALLEAGTDPARKPDTTAFYNYLVPGLFARAAEDPATSWEFFVRHYSAEARHKADSKYSKSGKGIFYPRAAALGGCTSHHAMITVSPHDDDWKQMQELMPDKKSKESWSPQNMRKIFERLEDCQYLPRPREGSEKKPEQDTGPGHGFNGWLPLSMGDPTLALGDKLLLQILLRAFLAAYKQPHGNKPGDAISQGAEDLLKALQRGSPAMLAADKATLEALAGDVKKLQEEAKRKQDEGGKWNDIVDFFMGQSSLTTLFQRAYAQLDPNRPFKKDADRVGAFNTPLSVLHGVRTSVRERILGVQALYPERLRLFTGALVTRVLIEDGRAVGVRYLQREGLYQATPPSRRRSREDLEPRELRVRPDGEVILAGGAFNTPQLLMLSGVGDREHLKEMKIRKVHCHSPGVGQNLQDRYEVTYVTELPEDKQFKVLDGLKFEAPSSPATLGQDRGMKEWINHRGVYATNGVVMTILLRSPEEKEEVPDLFLFALPGYFRGYFPGYSKEIQSEKRGFRWVENHRRFSWVVLKGRTRNRGGFVRLRSNDPLDRPLINFRYFKEGKYDEKQEKREGKEGWRADLDALGYGLKFARDIMESTGLVGKVLVPPQEILDDKTKLEEYIMNESWGHHACGTCQIGKDDDPMAVLDGDFRVRGVENLRVVDASVFPRIPGFFIVSAVYMISEKASDTILEERRDPKSKKKWPGPPKGP